LWSTGRQRGAFINFFPSEQFNYPR
jgi:hypothetical protein